MNPVYYDFTGTNMYVTPTALNINNEEGSSAEFYYYIFYDELGNYA